ncbi:NADPH:quinone reductase [Jatrophihabitans telluris]|uniref:NADPH:quinone reductase n=1 Tax=Jatrophihabitans telluris TaxID=2038343 RepID=A0ABY4R302_9ACTN|nr:NADPH:quinone reductase [Jatrophihabitans telluris]UQX89409.1 NADPH:quinone reductase [Jatrophihabitans telluris]
MRAICYSETGDESVLRLVDLAVPEPGPGQLRVRVHRSGVNPTDWKARQGSAPGAPIDPPQTPGQDGAGVVEAVGPGVEAAWTGLRVWIREAAYQRPHGTCAEYCLVPVHQVATLPDWAGYDLGASLGIPFMTAHRCLTVTEDGPKRLGPGALAGRVVLVAGGAGAVGNAAIQLARWSDARVIATVSSAAKGQLAAAAGADVVINYRNQDVVPEIRKVAPHGVNTIVEVAAAANVGIDADVVAANGSIACYADDGGKPINLPVRPSMVVNARWQFVLIYTAPPAAKSRAVEDIADAVLDRAIRVGPEAGLPLHHFSLEDAAQAHGAVAAGQVGKVLIDVGD